LGAKTELAIKPKDGMADKITSLFIKTWSSYNGSNHNIHKYV
jgi:hypothetical protein